MELEAANSKGNSGQLFQIVKSMTGKFHLRLHGTVSSQQLPKISPKLHKSQTGEKSIVKTCTVMRKKVDEQEYWEQEPPPLRSEVARAIRQTASRKATGPDEVPAELFKAGG